jgi:4-amino-4-deoxy-L-arabinose transferase-like glycosyltransferase
MMPLVLASAASAALLAAAAAGFRAAVRRVHPGGFPSAFRWLLFGLGAVFAAGIWWGVPWAGWAADELPPWLVLDGVDRHFSGGWFDKYPPLQYYLDAILYAPFLIARAAAGVDLGSQAALGLLQLAIRALSLAMGLGAVVGIYVAADDLYGAPGALAAAAVAGVTLPFVYYAKLANVDVPYLFWFAWSMVFYARTIRQGGTANAVWFGLTAALAVETKDQAYGFYVLPFLHALAVRRRPVVVAIGAGIATFLVVSNVVLNPSGFVAHVRALTDVGSDLRFELPGTRLSRQVTIWRLSAVSAVFSMTWIGVIAAAAGLADEIRRRRYWWLVLPIVSYYLFFLSTITSVFDRYLLGDFLVMAIAAGGWLGSVVAASPTQRRLRTALVAAALAVMAWYGASIDLLMIKDSRYPAARWLHEHAAPGARVALLGPRAYLPIVEPAHLLRGVPPPAAIAPADLPEFVVVNAEVMRRPSMAAVDREWWTWISSGRSPYVPVRTFTTRPAASLLSYFSTFTNGVEDEYTNLDKVAPPIVVYARTAVGR